ncbi:MAG: hypothetical protein AB7H71_10240 [Alphaproteobacteria bacterium]
MGAVSDIALLSWCAEFTLSHSEAVRERVHKELEASAQTSLIMTLRTIRLQGVVLAIGMLSLFESLLQAHLRWDRPFDQLDEYLKQHEKCELAAKFNQYRLAVNVLKHGRGKSYERLLAMPGELEFKIKKPGESFFDEGEVSEIDTLIDVDDQLVRRCATLIQEIACFIRSKENVWI